MRNRSLQFVAFAAIVGVTLWLGVRTSPTKPVGTDEPVVVVEHGHHRPTAAPSLPEPPKHTQLRAPGEWQGMLVDTERRAMCDTSSRCGLAAACLDGLCGACVRDDQCADGETCVLDHCVKRALASCHTRHDCAATELCVLSGYSTGDPRGNRDLTARCTPSSGSTAPVAVVDPDPVPSAVPRDVDPMALEDEARTAAIADRP